MVRPLVLAVTGMVFLPLGSVWQRCCAAEGDWPGWRGPKRDGWVSGFRLPAKWPEELQQRWQVDVGIGYASPVVAGDHVYQHARQGEDEVVWCLDLQTGAAVWRQSYAAPFTMGRGGERHGKGPKSSPAFAEDRLFTLSITGVLSAWEAVSGKLLWRREYSERFPKRHPYWGVATSPLVDGRRVVVHFGGDDRGALIALDAASGKEIWSHGNDGPSYASPILVEIDGQRQIIELTMRGLVSVNSKSGRLLWKYPFPQVTTNQNMVTPAYYQGLVLQGGENRGILALEPRLENDVWKAQRRWHQKEVALNMSSAVVNGDLLYGFSHYGNGRLFCLDIETGQVRWQGPGRTGENVAFLALPGHIVALINDGQLQIIAANGEHLETVASYRVAKGSTWAPPVLLPGGVLVKDDRTLTLWSLADSAREGQAKESN